MRPIFWICLMTLLCATVSAQNNSDYDAMLDNAESIVFNQPEESIKIADHVLKNSNNPSQFVRAGLLNTAAYYLKGEYENSVKAVVEAKKRSELTDNIPLQLSVSVASIPLLYHLGLDKVAEQYFANTSGLTERIKTNEVNLLTTGGKALLAGYKKSDEKKWLQALENFNEAKSTFEKIPNPVLEYETEIALTELYSKAYDSTTTFRYLETLLKPSDGSDPGNYLKMVALNQMGELAFNHQNNNKALKYDTAALEIARQLNTKNYRAGISENLASVYLAMKDIPDFYTYRSKTVILDKEVDQEEDRAVNAIYTYINNNHEQKRDTQELKYKRNLSILGALLVLIILIRTLLKLRYQKRALQYQKFISYIESGNETVEMVQQKETSKGLNIPEETEKALIRKLNQFEKSKQFTKQDMSLAQLAAHFETNTKYISEIINTHKGKNFNSYINELRVNYIIDKLKKDDTYLQYKISYLAEECGFSSHSSFATVFKSVTGISPTVFIDLLKSTKRTTRKVYEEVE